MSTVNVLSWGNENSLSTYPLTEVIDPLDMLVDAQFVQFDGYIPNLMSVFVNNSSLQVTLALDTGLRTYTLQKADADQGQRGRYLRLYTPDGHRYVGTLTFGDGLSTLWTDYVGRTLKYNVPFDASTVRAIPSQGGVYTFDGQYGAVKLTKDSSDSCIFYNVKDDTITLNAVGGHDISGAPVGLRQLNLVKPLHNNINISSNDVLKVRPNNANSLTLDLIAGDSSSTFSVNTLNS